jgi:predicted RNase H-like HicB family nuclease
MNPRSYAVVVIPSEEDEGGGFVAYVPDLPGCMSDGDTAEEATSNVYDAIEEWICEATDSGQIVPEPGSVAAREKRSRSVVQEVIERQQELIEAQDALVDEIERRAARLEQALQEAKGRSELTDEMGWFMARLSKHKREHMNH